MPAAGPAAASSLTVGTLAGSGVIAANGGAGNGWAAGAAADASPSPTPRTPSPGCMSAYGGGGYARGGAGTIYTKAKSSSWGQVVVDNGGQAGTNTSWTSSGTIDLTVTGGAVVCPAVVANIRQPPGHLERLDQREQSESDGDQQCDGPGRRRHHRGRPVRGWPGTGSGQGACSHPGYVGGGGGYGGYGAASWRDERRVYWRQPLRFGDRADEPMAAAAARIFFVPALRRRRRGRRSHECHRCAAGQRPDLSQRRGWHCAGRRRRFRRQRLADAGTLAGAGTISANGGAGNELGGGGGGGCIALQYGVNAFEGVMSAYGGGGYAWGGAGTIYTKANSQSHGPSAGG